MSKGTAKKLSRELPTESDKEMALEILSRILGDEARIPPKSWLSSWNDGQLLVLSHVEAARHFRLHSETLDDEYGDAWNQWGCLPPIIVVQAKGVGIIVEGNHRANQACKDRASVRAYVVQLPQYERHLLAASRKLVDGLG